MKRREFLEYLVLSGAVCCVGCNKFQKNTGVSSEVLLDKMIKNKELEIIKFPICYHCNLNCAYCCHFSPIAPKYEMPVEVFENDVKQLKKITKGKVKTLSLMGGEPLLHKNIQNLLTILNKYFPNSRKRITTNGLLLENMDKKFYTACKDNNIAIECSDYYLFNKNINSDVFEKIKEKYGIDIKFNREKIDKFELARLNNKKINEKNYSLCDKKYGCTQLDNGKIYPCSIASNIKIFNDYFKDYTLPVNDNDFIDIHRIDSIDEIFEYFKKPKEICKYCNLGHNRKLAKWKISDKKLEEWYEK